MLSSLSFICKVRKTLSSSQDHAIPYAILLSPLAVVPMPYFVHYFYKPLLGKIAQSTVVFLSSPKRRTMPGNAINFLAKLRALRKCRKATRVCVKYGREEIVGFISTQISIARLVLTMDASAVS